MMFRFMLGIGVLLLAVATAAFLIWTKETAERKAPESVATLVETITATPRAHTVRIEALGTVQAAQEISLRPEVAGRVVRVSEKLIPGGQFRQGEIMAEIDPRDYQYALEKAKASLEQAAFNLKVEQGRQTVAKKEWDLFDDEVTATEAGRALALRQPHMQNAQAAMLAAQAAVAQARLNLERTAIYAPFDCQIISEQVDPGQQINANTTIAQLAGTARYRVQVAVPVHTLRWIGFYGNAAVSEQEPEAGVTQILADGTAIRRTGRVTRLLADLDPVGRLARLLVTIDDPLQLTQPEVQRDAPLLLGAYVQVGIEGETIETKIPVPRAALHDGNALWIMKPQSEAAVLEIRPVEVVWAGAEVALIGEGLVAGEQIVTSPIPAPVAGMKLKVKRETPPVSSSTDATPAHEPLAKGAAR